MRGYVVTVEYKVRRSIFISSHSAADSEEACELALEEMENSNDLDALVMQDLDVVDVREEE